MSRARQRADKTREKSAASRGTLKAQPGSVHRRIYDWWGTKTGKARARPNLCHYFWVVVLWAPLRWLVKPLLYTLGAAGLAAFVWMVATSGDVLTFTVMLAGWMYFIYSVLVGRQLLHDIDSSEFDIKAVEWLDDKPAAVKSLAVFSALPMLIVLTPIVLVGGTLFAFFMALHDDYDAYRKAWRWFTRSHFGDSAWVAWIRPWLVVPLMFGGLGFVSESIRKLDITLLSFAVLVGIGGGAILLLAWLSDVWKARRLRRVTERQRERNKAAIDEALEVMFHVLHPNWVGDTARFNGWKARYLEHYREVVGMHEYDTSEWSHIDVQRLSRAQYRQVRELLDQRQAARRATTVQPTIQYKEPSKLRQAFWTVTEGVSDFLSLVWSMVLAKKWRICPWVELPD
jgi:hypothetical protein